MSDKCKYCQEIEYRDKHGKWPITKVIGAVDWGCTCDPETTAEKVAEFNLYAN